MSLAEMCDKTNLAYSFTDCVNDQRSIIFSWNIKDCTNVPPSPINNVSCELICNPGTYLTFNIEKNETECSQCPINTYSTGNTIRVSDRDMNWNELPKETTQQCIWLENNMWMVEGCNSFVPRKDGSALVLNKAILKPDTLNMVEIKLALYLIKDGSISFTYKRSAKQETGYINGQMRFYLNFYSTINDTNASITGPQTYKYDLTKGPNELAWRFVLTTASNYADITAEFINIEVTYASQVPISCKSCNQATSAVGSSYCNNCPFNSIYDATTEQCTSCSKDKLAYPGDTVCRQRMPCLVEYDAVPKFSQCTDNRRSVSYSLREGSVCASASFVLPEAKKAIACEVCPMGMYIDTSSQTKCLRCGNGKYSTAKNSNSCLECAKGFYAPKALLFTDIESFPERILTSCKQADNASMNPCTIHKGWVVYDKAFRVAPYLPIGTVLAMGMTVNVIAKLGQLEFIYELGNQSGEFSLILDGTFNEFKTADSNKLISFVLVKGTHSIYWIYKKISGEEVQNKIAISFINITGIDEGTSHQCLRCPQGYISSGLQTECIPCSKGTVSNADNTECEKCPKGLHKDPLMETCSKCPANTHTDDSGIHCVLFDSYNIGGNYLLNLLKFELDRVWALDEIKDRKKSGSFFGPFSYIDKNVDYFFSPKIPVYFDVEIYEYEEPTEGVEVGHVFSLTLIKNEYELSTTESPQRKSHYRIKQNLGSELVSAKVSDWSKGEFVFEYINGDFCTKTERYRSTIKLVCDRTLLSISFVEIPKGTDVCAKEFIWRTPYACSECTYNDTKKYVGNCNKGKRSVYLEEGDNCIIHLADNSNIRIQDTVNDTVDLDLFVNFPSKYDAIYENFVFTDEVKESCNELELSLYITIAIICIFIILIVVVVIGLIITFRYRKKCYQILESSESRVST